MIRRWLSQPLPRWYWQFLFWINFVSCGSHLAWMYAGFCYEHEHLSLVALQWLAATTLHGAGLS